MITFSQKYWFLYITTIFLLISDTAILLDVSIVRQIFGFLFLTVIPGFLILLMIGPFPRLLLTEKCILVIGASISFIYFFGLLINTLLPIIGYTQPLSTLPILVSFNLFFIICSILIVFRNNHNIFSSPKIEINIADKILLIFPILLPALTILSIYLLNSTKNSLPIIVTLIMLIFYLAGMVYIERREILHIYPFVLISIAFSLSSIFMLRFPHISGADVHLEYGQVFLNTLEFHLWEGGALTINNILSVTLLPTIFQVICNVGNLELFFKFIFVSICLIMPLAIYCFSRKYVGDLYGFFAAFFTIIQTGYIFTAANPRTNIAVTFCALTLYVLFCDNIEKGQKFFFSVLFVAAVVVSHYATINIFFFLLIIAVIGTYLLGKKFTFFKSITFIFILITALMIFGWFVFASRELLFSESVHFVSRIINNFSEQISSGFTSSEDAQLLFNPEFKNQFFAYIHYFITWLSLISIGFGFFYSVFYYKKFVRISDFEFEQSDFLKSKIEPELFFFAAGCIGLLGANLILNAISRGYDSFRLFLLTTIILSLFLVIGIISAAWTFSNLIKFLRVSSLNPHVVTSATMAGLLLLSCIFNFGIPYELVGNPQLLLSSEHKGYQISYVHDSEGVSGQWLKNFTNKTDKIFVPGYTEDSLISVGRIPLYRITIFDNFKVRKANKQYIFFGLKDIIDGYYIRDTLKTYSRADLTEKQNKIYANNGGEIFMFK